MGSHVASFEGVGLRGLDMRKVSTSIRMRVVHIVRIRRPATMVGVFGRLGVLSG